MKKCGEVKNKVSDKLLKVFAFHRFSAKFFLRHYIIGTYENFEGINEIEKIPTLTRM